MKLNLEFLVIPFFTALTVASAMTVCMKPAYASQLRILTESWPPISFEEKGSPQGMAVEVVKAIQTQIGQSSTSSIEVVPWARGYSLLQSSPNTLLFTMVRTPERDKLFTLLGPIAHGKTSLFALKSAAQKKYARSMELIKSKALVAATRGTAFETILRDQKFQNILDVKDPETAVKMLMSGRVDLLCDDSLIIYNILKKNGFAAEKIQTIAVLNEYDLYLGFSAGTEAKTISVWKKSLEAIKQNGQYAAIYRKWFPRQSPPTSVKLVGLSPLAH